MIRLPRACRGRAAVRLPANSFHMCCVELALKGLASAGKCLAWSLTNGYAMLMSPSKGETTVHGCHCPRDMAVRMREIVARPWVGVCVPLASMYWKLVIHFPRACRGRTAVRFPANSSHILCAELALDRLLCTLLGSKRFLRRGFSPFFNPTALPRWLAPIRAKQLSVAATARVKWLCVCVRYWPVRGLVYICMPLASSLHYFQCNRIKFNLSFINYCIS